MAWRMRAQDLRIKTAMLSELVDLEMSSLVSSVCNPFVVFSRGLWWGRNCLAFDCYLVCVYWLKVCVEYQSVVLWCGDQGVGVLFQWCNSIGVLSAHLEEFEKKCFVVCNIVCEIILCVCVRLFLFYIHGPIIWSVVCLHVSVVFISCGVVCVSLRRTREVWSTRECLLRHLSVHDGMHDVLQVTLVRREWSWVRFRCKEVNTMCRQILFWFCPCQLLDKGKFV